MKKTLLIFVIIIVTIIIGTVYFSSVSETSELEDKNIKTKPLTQTKNTTSSAEETSRRSDLIFEDELSQRIYDNIIKSGREERRLAARILRTTPITPEEKDKLQELLHKKDEAKKVFTNNSKRIIVKCTTNIGVRKMFI